MLRNYLFTTKKNKLKLWYDEEDVLEGETLFFNEDVMEHIDFLSNDKGMIDILKNNKVKGEITFASEGGEGFWGHRFDGKGGYKRLQGILTFMEVEE